MYNIQRYYMNRTESSEIIVKGNAVEYAYPNMATVTVRVSTTGTNPLEVELLNGKRIDQVLEWLTKYGVQDKDITVEKGMVTPLTDEEGDIISHKVNAYIAVNFYNLIAIHEYMKNIIAEKIEVIEIIATINDLDKLYDMSLNRAVLRAYDKAKIIAESMNAELLPTPTILIETSNQEKIRKEITQTVKEIKDIEFKRFDIPASVEAKFSIERVLND